MKKLLKISIAVVLAGAVCSLIPAAQLYLEKGPAPYSNEDAAHKLEANKGENFQFIVFGDNHAGLIFNDSAALKLIRHMNREDRFGKLPVDLAVSPGDVTFRGSAWDYSIYNRIRARVKYPVISGAGNHDNDAGGRKLFKKYIGEHEFSFTDRNSRFIIVDDTDNDLTEEQFARLERELERSASSRHRFVIAHKMPLSAYQQSWYRPELSPWGHRFMKLCEKYKVDMVICGHEHMFRSRSYGGVKYLVSGGGGIITQAPESDGGFLHYVVVRVYGDHIDYEVRKVCPPLWELLTYYIWKDIFYLLKGVVF